MPEPIYAVSGRLDLSLSLLRLVEDELERAMRLNVSDSMYESLRTLKITCINLHRDLDEVRGWMTAVAAGEGGQ